MHIRRKMAVKPQGAVQSDINVTPLVDVVLVLLIIFMVMTPLMQKHLAVQLPVKEEAAMPPPSPETVPLVVGITAGGQLTLNDEPLREEDYVPRLKRVLAARPKGQRELFFQPDDSAGYARLVLALDGAKAAGAEGLGVMTK